LLHRALVLEWLARAELKRLPTIEKFWSADMRMEYPTFATALPVVLSRHPSNVGAESFFSHVSLVLTKRRGNLGPEMASTLTVLHYDGYKVVNQFVADAKA